MFPNTDTNNAEGKLNVWNVYAINDKVEGDFKELATKRLRIYKNWK